MLPADLLRVLRCPACHGPLDGRVDAYRCSACDRNFPIVGGVARFVQSSDYTASFGYQWRKFSQTQLRPDVSACDLRGKTALNESDFRGKLVLDAGCGSGRFAEVATRWGARVIGVDLSNATEVAAVNLKDREFWAMQADLFSLPFAPGSFDCIYSVGVLHHTPNCEAAFRQLVQYLAPGGSIGVWLYSAYNNWYRCSDQYRRITHRTAPSHLYSAMRIAVPVLYGIDRGLRALPLIGRPLAGFVHHLFPISLNSEPEIRVLDTLDWYSPRYQSKHTYEEVFRWYESCGLEGMTVGDESISVRGRRPDKPEAVLQVRQAVQPARPCSEKYQTPHLFESR